MNNKITLTFFENSMLQDLCESEYRRLRQARDKAENKDTKYIDAMSCILVNLLMKLRDEL